MIPARGCMTIHGIHLSPGGYDPTPQSDRQHLLGRQPRDQHQHQLDIPAKSDPGNPRNDRHASSTVMRWSNGKNHEKRDRNTEFKILKTPDMHWIQTSMSGKNMIKYSENLWHSFWHLFSHSLCPLGSGAPGAGGQVRRREGQEAGCGSDKFRDPHLAGWEKWNLAIKHLKVGHGRRCHRQK